MNIKTETHSFQRNLSVAGHYDLIVCGGGPSGVPAALAAARNGLKVLLIESSGQLGGAGVSAGVSHLLGCRAVDNSCWAVAGLLKEVTEDLAAIGGAIHPETIKPEKYSPHGWTGAISTLTYGVPFDPVAMSALLDRKMLEAGVDVLFFTQFVDVEITDSRIQKIIVSNKSGLLAYGTRVVVDATGDADVAWRAGCDYVKGREGDELMAPASLIFHVNNVDQDALASEIYRTNSYRFRELIQRLRESGEWTFPYEIFISVQLHEKGTLMINTTRHCDVDGTDGASVSKGMIRGRSEMIELFALMRKYFPGFKDARIKMVASSLGVRETRRIRSDFVYRVQDILNATDFPDTIAWSAYGWDLPDPKRPSHQPMHGGKTELRRLVTPIPYRCLVPRPIKNLICPGRAISVERDVLGPLREQGPCYAMGHAAGIAAAMSLKSGVSFADVDITRLQEKLIAEGAVVNDPLQPKSQPSPNGKKRDGRPEPLPGASPSDSVSPFETATNTSDAEDIPVLVNQ
ncbi:FAD-dependent oxidoreductase [Geminisphaera colitermitum]|uniref:FAD-dependent oxidoreductase n=1 Tax=Geminisphaera colitermitum TaxID=1148786 RepID=UPI000158D5AC|nr:FAD-dependent oxidoreductase [Geminisphaera colitermitum]